MYGCMIFIERLHDFIRHVILDYTCASLLNKISSTVCGGLSRLEYFITSVLAEDFKSLLCMDLFYRLLFWLWPSGCWETEALDAACGNLLVNKRINNNKWGVLKRWMSLIPHTSWPFFSPSSGAVILDCIAGTIVPFWGWMEVYPFSSRHLKLLSK